MEPFVRKVRAVLRALVRRAGQQGPAAYYIEYGRAIAAGHLPRDVEPAEELLWNEGATALLVRGKECGKLTVAHDDWHYLTVDDVFPVTALGAAARARASGKAKARAKEADEGTVHGFLDVVTYGRFGHLTGQTPTSFYHTYQARDLAHTFEGGRLTDAVQGLKASLIWLAVAMLGAIVLLGFALRGGG